MNNMNELQQIRELIKKNKLDIDPWLLLEFFKNLEFKFVTVENYDWYEVSVKGFSWLEMWEIFNLPTAFTALQKLKEESHINYNYLVEYVSKSILRNLLKKAILAILGIR